MKKVLFVLNNMNIGGTEKAFLNMVDTMTPEEYDVTLLLLERSGGFLSMVPEWVHVEVIDGYDTMKAEIMDPPLQIVKRNIQQGKLMRAVGLAFTHLLFKISEDRTLYYRFVLSGKKYTGQFDAAIAYCGPFDFLTVYVLYFVNAVKKIQWIHFDVSKFQFNTKMCSRLYPRFDEIYVVSEEARQRLVEKLPGITGKTKTFFNVVSRQKCRELADQGCGFADGYKGLRIITVGRLSEEKGQDLVPQVAKTLFLSGVNFRWYLVGDGKLRGEIEKEAKEYDVEDKIVFLGTQVNPYQYLKSADIYVQTSRHEGYCITLAEARAFDLPIVSTDCAGAHDQLDGRKKSFVVERDVNAMADAILKLI